MAWTVAAGSCIDQLAVARLGSTALRLRRRDVFAAASTRVGQAPLHQCIQRGLVGAALMRLVAGGLVAVQTTLGELAQNKDIKPWQAAGAVDVFHTHQPLSAMRPRIQPAGQRRHQ